MNEIERFLDQVCCGVGGSPDLRRHLRRELEEHLTEEIEANVAAGMGREEAVHKAIGEFGDPVVIRDGLQAVHGRRLMSLLIEKSMNWREKTMKTGWKWNFAAQVALMLTIAAELYFAAAAVVYVLPVIFAMHHRLGTPPFAYIGTIRQLSDVLYAQFGWAPCLLLVLAGWGLFEWRYRGENRSIIRLTGLSAASLLMFVVLAVVWIPIVIDLAILPRQIHTLQVDLTPQQAERVVLPEIAAGDAAFKSLSTAIRQGDWPVADRSAGQLSDAYRSLADAGPGVILLAGETRRDNLDGILALIDEVADSSRDLRGRVGLYECAQGTASDDLKARVLTAFGHLEESYSKLSQTSGLFAAHVVPATRQ